jgi:flagellin FlaB
VVLGAGFFTTQKSQETVYKGVEQATSNIQMIGQVYGQGEGNGVTIFNFTIGIAPGAPSIDLTKMTIMVSNETTAPVLYQHSSTTGNNKFVTNKAGVAVTTMSAQDQVDVGFNTSANFIAAKNTKVTIELRPAVGASLPFTRTIPPTVKAVNVLY